MQSTPKSSTSWRDRLQIAAQLAGIGSFIAALAVVTLAALNYRGTPPSSVPIEQSSR